MSSLTENHLLMGLISITSQVISFAFNAHANTLTQSHSESFFFFPSLSLTQNHLSPLCETLWGGVRWLHIPFLVLPLKCLMFRLSATWYSGDQVHKLRFLYQQVLTWENFRRRRISTALQPLVVSQIVLFEWGAFFIWASICWLTPKSTLPGSWVGNERWLKKPRQLFFHYSITSWPERANHQNRVSPSTWHGDCSKAAWCCDRLLCHLKWFQMLSGLNSWISATELLPLQPPLSLKAHCVPEPKHAQTQRNQLQDRMWILKLWWWPILL